MLEGLGSGAHALDHNAAGDDDPEGVHQDVVSVEVKGLRTAVHLIVHLLVEEAGGVVEDVAIELAQADDDGGRVAQRVVDEDEVGDGEGEWAPGDGGDGLHAGDEGVLGLVAGVGERVLLPELTEKIGAAGHMLKVVGEVT